MSKFSLYSVIAFLVGCVAAQWVPFEIPEATAVNMSHKVENICVTTNEAVDKNVVNSDFGPWNKFLKKMNRKGYRLVTVGYDRGGIDHACFERPAA